MLEQNRRTPKRRMQNKSLSKSNNNLNATQFSEKKQAAMSPNNALMDFRATFSSLSPTNGHASKAKSKKSDFHHAIGKSSSSH